MVELVSLGPGVIGCFATPDALDDLEKDEFALRVAPSELLLVGCSGQLDELEAKVSALDAQAVVLDLSGGYAVFGLRGSERHEAICRLTAIELSPAPSLVQGLVAHLPAKLLIRRDEFLILVPATVGHHLREQVVGVCADLVLTETTDELADEL